MGTLDAAGMPVNSTFPLTLILQRVTHPDPAMTAQPFPLSCKLPPATIRNLQCCQPVAALGLISLLIFTFAAPTPVRAMAPTRHHAGETESGNASWYGADQGHYTASGERFDPDALTAATRHLPFGTIVRVTNTLNGRSVEVRINDRGPWSHGRIIDVSSAAADVLDMKRAGIVPVKLEVIKLGLDHHHAS
jgi:rare lipoprotein A